MEKICHFIHIRLQGNGQRDDGLSLGNIVFIAADLGEELAVDICPFIDLRIGKSMFVDQPQKTGLKAFTDLGQDIVQIPLGTGTGRRSFRCGCRRLIGGCIGY